MNTNTIKDALKKIAIRVGRIPFLRKLLRKPYDYYKGIAPRKSLANLKKHGFEAIQVFDRCMKSHGIQYTLAFGTLLGSIREHDFIPHDDDIDVAMWIEDYNPEILSFLNEVGIKLKHSFSVGNDKFGKEDTFIFKGVLIDIFYFYHEMDDRVYCCDFVNQKGCISRADSINKYGGLLPRKIYVPLDKKTTSVEFKGLHLSIPANYDEILTFRYGADYMTPKPGWKPQSKYIIEATDWLGNYREY